MLSAALWDWVSCLLLNGIHSHSVELHTSWLGDVWQPTAKEAMLRNSSGSLLTPASVVKELIKIQIKRLAPLTSGQQSDSGT